MFQAIRDQGGHLNFTIRKKKYKLDTRRWDLASCQVPLNSVQRFQRGNSNVSDNQRPGGHLVFMIGPKNTNLVEDIEILLLVKFIWIPLSSSEEESKMSQPIRDRGGHLVFPIGPKNTNLVEGVEILLAVKFCWIPFSDFRGEVENISANQRPGQPSCVSLRHENTNLVEGIDILLPVKFRWIPFSRFRGEGENISTNQSQGRPSCFFFRSARKTQTW